MARKLRLSDLGNAQGAVTPRTPSDNFDMPTPAGPSPTQGTQLKDFLKSIGPTLKGLVPAPMPGGTPKTRERLVEEALYDRMVEDNRIVRGMNKPPTQYPNDIGMGLNGYSNLYPTDIPMGNVRGTQNYPMDIPMGNMGRTSDLAAAQRQRDFQSLVDGAPDMRAQRALDQQFYATDYRPASGSSNGPSDTSIIPPSRADQQAAAFGEIGGNLAPGNQNNGSTFKSPKYPNPVYGGYSVEALQELKANLAGTQNQRNLLTRNRAMDMDDLTRGYDKNVAAVPAGYNQKGLVDSGLVGRDVKRAGTDYGRSAGRIDMAFNDSFDTLFKKDDGFRRKAIDDSYKGFNADVERRAAMAPDIRSALG